MKLNHDPEALRWALDKSGLTQRQLGAAVNRSESLVSEWLSGRRNTTSLDLNAIADVLKCPRVVIEAKHAEGDVRAQNPFTAEYLRAPRDAARRLVYPSINIVDNTNLRLAAASDHLLHRDDDANLGEGPCILVPGQITSGPGDNSIAGELRVLHLKDGSHERRQNTVEIGGLLNLVDHLGSDRCLRLELGLSVCEHRPVGKVNAERLDDESLAVHDDSSTGDVPAATGLTITVEVAPCRGHDSAPAAGGAA